MKLKENITGNKAIYDTEFELTNDQENLIVSFTAYHASLNSYSDIYNDELYNGNVVEIFIQTNDKNKYFEIEVAPNNANFLALITNDGVSFKGELIPNNFVKSYVDIKNDIWKTKILVPLKEIEANNLKEIKYNAFRIDTDNEITNKHLFAISPTKCGTFHKMESFIVYTIK